jgi:hypothetical protein
MGAMPGLWQICSSCASEKIFSWGRDSLREAGEARERYIEALRAADRYDIAALLAFARA